MRVLNLQWARRMEELISKNLEVDEVQRYPVHSVWLIEKLARADRPFKVINLGGGVKRITTKVDLCKKCNGTGKC